MGRRWNRDPKGKVNLSDYSVFGDNPIRNSDKNGDIFGWDNVIGAVVGAVVEVGSQMVSNYIEHKPLLKIDWADVAVSAGEGFLTSGISSVYKKLAIKGGAAILRSLVDVDKDGVRTAGGIIGQKKDPSDIGADLISEAIGVGTGIGSDAVAKSTSKVWEKPAKDAVGKFTRSVVEKAVGGAIDVATGGIRGAIKDQGKEERKDEKKGPHIIVGPLTYRFLSDKTNADLNISDNPTPPAPNSGTPSTPNR